MWWRELREKTSASLMNGRSIGAPRRGETLSPSASRCASCRPYSSQRPLRGFRCPRFMYCVGDGGSDQRPAGGPSASAPSASAGGLPPSAMGAAANHGRPGIRGIAGPQGRWPKVAAIWQPAAREACPAASHRSSSSACGSAPSGLPPGRRAVTGSPTTANSMPTGGGFSGAIWPFPSCVPYSFPC
jgi:hypothetical protein